MNIIQQEIEQLTQDATNAKYDIKDIQEIQKAALFAAKKHDGQLRKSGEPYVIHPIETARILISWNVDIPTIIAGLLHDVLEDTMTEEHEISDEFGKEVLTLVKYVTKVSLYSRKNRINQEEKTEIEKTYTIQVFLSMASDLRAMIIKLADRYHNMTTIKYLPDHKQHRIAKETFEIYAKVAGILGMYSLKTDLLDLSFAVLNPQAYNQTKLALEKMVEQNEFIWKEKTEKIKNVFDSYSFEYEIKSRVKGIYSTWEKQEKGYEIKDIHDIFAIRIIVNTALECYSALGLIHLNFTYLKNAFKDYISTPKLNLYQSLHTTIYKHQTLMEVQIRTKEMDLIAMNGVAAHWRYKDDINEKINQIYSNDLIQEFLKSPEKNVEEIKKLTNDVVFDVLVLNNEKTYIINNKTKLIDLAYRYDNANLKHLKRAFVNGERTMLDTSLHQGDVIKFEYSNDILTIKDNWVKYTNIKETQLAIKEILNVINHNKMVNLNDFKNKIKKKLGINFVGEEKMLTILRKKMNVNSIDEFLDIIPNEMYNDDDLINIFHKQKNISKLAQNNLSKKYAVWKMGQMYFNPINGLMFDKLEFPTCCNKVPYMDVVGKIVKGNLEVHSHNCPNAKSTNYRQKIYPLTWNKEQLEKNPRTFKFTLSFEATWLPSIGNIIAKNLNRYKLSLTEMKIKRFKAENSCKVDLILYVSNISLVKACLGKISEEVNIKTKFAF